MVSLGDIKNGRRLPWLRKIQGGTESGQLIQNVLMDLDWLD